MPGCVARFTAARHTKEGTYMKLCVKITAAVIAIALIPMIVFYVFVTVKLRDNNFQTARDRNLQFANVGAEFINNKFSGIISDVKWCAENRYIVKYASNAQQYKKGGSNISGYADAMNMLEKFTDSADIYAVEITNADGTVILSSLDDEGELSRFEENGNDVNGVYPMETADGIPVIRFEKRIYSAESNTVLGKVRFVYNISLVSDILSASSSDAFMKYVVVDSSSNIIETPYKMIRTITWSVEYQKFADEFIKHMNSENKELSFEEYDYHYDKKDKSVSAGYVPGAGWYIMGIVNLSDYSKENSLSTVFIWIVAAAAMAAAGMCILRFLSPLRKITEFLDCRSKGDVFAPLEIKSNDEFEEAAFLLLRVVDTLSGSELRYRTIAEMSDNIVFDVDLAKNTVMVTNNFDKKFSFRPRDDSLKESFIYKTYIYRDDKGKFLSDFDKILNTEDSWFGEYRMKTLYGDFAWIRIQAKKLRSRTDKPTRIVGVMTDIDREKESELHLIQKANFDALTQLNNRESFIRQLSAETARIVGKGSLLAVMFIDLDDFKHFNDNYGHKCGDEVLKYTADVIKELSYGKGFGGRFGGDEFIMCLTDLKLIGDAGHVAEDLITMLNKGIDSMSMEVHLSIGCSVGIAFYGENGNTADEIIAAADAAMYKIKKHGKSNYAFASAGEAVEDSDKKETSSIDSDNKTDADEADSSAAEAAED